MRNQNQDEFYSKHYEVIMGHGNIGRIMNVIHKRLDKPFLSLSNLEIVEVGAGHSQHLQRTQLRYVRYVEVDIREMNHSHIRQWDPRIVRVLADAQSLEPFHEGEFNLLIATCLLAHLADPELALRNFRRVIRHSGYLSLYVPCEPGIFLRLVRRFTTKRRIEKFGYNHKWLHWREHRNHYPLLESLIEQVFAGDTIKISKFPFPMFPWDFNLYTHFIIRVEK